MRALPVELLMTVSTGRGIQILEPAQKLYEPDGVEAPPPGYSPPDQDFVPTTVAPLRA